jgi:hypothetical protein
MKPLSGPMNQINITFNPLEDRLLLRTTTKQNDAALEYKIWLTRRLVKLLIPVLDKMLENESQVLTQVSGDNRKAVLEFQQQAALAQTDFSTPYSTENKQTPLGDDPLLVSKIHAGKDQNGKPVLSLKTEDDKGVSLGMTTQMIHSFKSLLANGMSKAGWDINLAPPRVEKPINLI